MMARRAAILLPLLPLFLSCGGSGGSGGIPVADFGNSLADATCDWEVGCGVAPDKATCLATFAVNEGQLIEDLKVGRVRYDGNAATACVAAIRDGSCSVRDYPAIGQPAPCDEVVKGTLTAGATCVVGNECVSGNCNTGNCVPGALCCTGTCDAPLLAAAGADCGFYPTYNCVAGTSCQQGPTGSTCVPGHAPGQPCANIEDCVPGDACIYDPTQLVETCAVLPAEGEACNIAGACDAIDDYCDYTTGNCTRRVAAGGACPQGNECVAWVHCSPTLTCVAFGTVGAACVSTGDDCLAPLVCVVAECALPTAVVCS